MHGILQRGDTAAESLSLFLAVGELPMRLPPGLLAVVRYLLGLGGLPSQHAEVSAPLSCVFRAAPLGVVAIRPLAFPSPVFSLPVMGA